MINSNTVASQLAFQPEVPKGLNKDDRVRLKQQTDNFEAIVLKQMLDISMKDGESLFGKSVGSDIYKSMYHDTLGKELAGGFGYSELLFNFLTKKI